VDTWSDAIFLGVPFVWEGWLVVAGPRLRMLFRIRRLVI
jgi:hypothetical protein